MNVNPGPAKRSPESYKEQIQSLTGLPTLPEIAREIQDVIKEDNLSVNQMVPIIEKDPSLAAKLLKVVNSAFYGIQKEVESVRQAVVILGMKELANLALGFSVIKVLRGNDDVTKVEWERFWEHSAATGHIAEILNGELKTWVPSSPYSLGLLHDLGKIILFKIDSNLFIESLKFAHREKCLARKAEMATFGITHMEAGEWIAEKWKLPDAFKWVMGYHHDPSQTPDVNFHGVTALVNLANTLSNLKGIYYGCRTVFDLPEEIEGWRVLQGGYEHLRSVDLVETVPKWMNQFDVIKNIVTIAGD